MTHEVLPTDFLFLDDDQPGVQGEFDRIVRLPRGLERKPELLGALATALGMPHYFGNNWDALSDCLRDLSWLPKPRVLLVHGDLPLRRAKHRRAYLDVLADAVRSWAEEDAGTFAVVFPPGTRDAVAAALADERRDASGEG